MHRNANGKCNCQGHSNLSLRKKPLVKCQGSTVQDPSNKHPSKRWHLTPRDNNNMRWVQREIAGIKEALEKMASEARENRQNFISTLEELNFAGIKESLDEMTYNAREERETLHNMLAELLAEVQERE
jgi:DNA-directed RNA polymerase subunit L